MKDRAAVSGKRAALEAVRAGLVRELLVADDLRETAGVRELLEAAQAAQVAVRTRPRATLDRMAHDHRGVVARLASSRSLLSERDLSAYRFDEDDVVVILDGIKDPQNLGAAARSAEAAGVALIVTRTRRAAIDSPAATRASAGALLHLPWAQVANISRAAIRLRDRGFSVIGLDDRAADSIHDVPCPTGRVALVIGSEGEGISSLVRAQCDALVSIPMRGRVGSLNASSALAAALWAYVLPSRRR